MCINKSRALRGSLFFPALIFVSGSTKGFEAKYENKPNIIIINIDDMGWRDVGFMGSEYYETPNIDKLAGKGMIFTNAYAAAANCAPSRAGLMSGNWTTRHGIYTVGNSDRGKSKDRRLIPIPNTDTLASNIQIIPEILKGAGYITCHAGKWHVTDDPLNRGFDVNIGGSHAGNPGSYYPPYKNVPSLIAPSPGYYLTNLVMDKTLDFVHSVSERPFFSVLCALCGSYTHPGGKKPVAKIQNQSWMEWPKQWRICHHGREC